MRKLAWLFFLVAASLPLSLPAQIDPDLLAGMKARSIGPASMSGRVVAIDAVESNPNIIYAGAATGGLWKSVDAGITWTPIFDDQPVAAIGAIGIAQQSPDIIWVGTGETSIRNSASVGNGIYRSIDGGKSWVHLGLENTERIARVIPDPRNANVALVAALGREWGENADRGVFKTEDGGKSWRKVLYVDQKTGAADLVIDPSNPNHLIASMWDFRRWPWFFRSGGEGSGVYVSYDAGESWKKQTEEDGLPAGILGRSTFAFSRSNPSIVYALVEAEKSALLRSEDGGKSWKSVNTDPDVAPRPFYFANIRVDPVNPNRIYNLWTQVTMSNDGGKTFEVLVPFAKVHPDHHAMWIDPHDGRMIVDGNDGGVAISRDRGVSWRFVENLPLGQFYHVAYDMEVPYNIYGGMQDNGSWRGPSSVWEPGGIRNFHWQEVGFGDGFGTVPIPSDPTMGYSMAQEGYLMRWDLKTGERKQIRPAGPANTKLRFNWNSGIATDPFDANTVYYGSQFLHKSTDRGEHWTIVSPDLTSNNPNWQKQRMSGGLSPDVSGAENFTTIISIAPSPVTRGVIWVGTDDGRVQVTKDGGATWTSVESNVRGVPANTWVPHVEASKFDAGTAFVVFDDHRRSNWNTYVFRTTDYGKSWTNLATKDVRGYALTLVQDPASANLLFLGTEFGLYASLDGGKSWMQWKHGVPTVSVMALAIQPRESDLIVATHGRSAFVVDDIRPLRSLSASTLNEPLHLFEISPAIEYTRKQTPGARFAGDSAFKGDNRPYGALITYSLNAGDLPIQNEERERARKEAERLKAKKPVLVTAEGVPQEALDLPKPGEAQAAEAKSEKPKQDDSTQKVEVSIVDSTGAVVRTMKVPAKLGINRTSWDLRRKAFRSPPKPEAEEDPDGDVGPQMPPGVYTVSMKFRDKEAKSAVAILPDPRTSISSADRTAKWNAILRAGALQEKLTTEIEQITRARADIDVVAAKLKPSDPAATKEDNPLIKRGTELKTQLDKLERTLWIPPKTKGIVPEDDPMSHISYLLGSLSSSWDAPTEAELAYLAQYEQQITAAVAPVDAYLAGDVAKYAQDVRSANIGLFAAPPPKQ